MRNFKQFLNEEELDSFFIKDYQIKDGKFDQSLLPFPNKVNDFYTDGSINEQMPLTSLEGCPSIIEDTFRCGYSHITSLKYGPKKVGSIDVSDCKYLTSLEYGPSEVTQNYYMANTSITSLEGIPKKLNGNLYCTGTKITSLEHAPLIVGKSVICNLTKIIHLRGIGQKYLKQIGDELWIPDTIESNILGICLISKLQRLTCIANINFDRMINIVIKYLHTDGDECMEELIQNGYKDYAKF